MKTIGKSLKTKVVDGKVVELTAKGNSYEMTVADAEALYEKMGRKSFDEYKTWPFPYPEYSQRQAISELRKLRDVQNGDKCASHIIRTIHKWRYHCLRGAMMSPVQYWEAFKDESFFRDESWKKFYINRLRNAQSSDATAFREDGIMRPGTISAGFTITHRADCPSYFKPHLAKRLVKTYLSEFNEVFCPFNGFSGMMLGTVVGNGKKYIGQDLNEKEISEAKEIAEIIKSEIMPDADITLKVQDMFSDSGEYECLIACPPYGDEVNGNIEKWNFDADGNSLDKSLTCDGWIDECVKRYKCKKYVFVVDDKTTKKWLPFVAEKLVNRGHFGSNVEYVVVITEDDLKKMK